MNDFFFNLVGRHLHTFDTIKPRTLGRFEVDRGTRSSASPAEGLNSLVSDGDVSTSTLHEPDLTGAEKEYSSSQKEQSNPLAQPRFSGQQEILADSPPVSRRTNKINPFDQMQGDTHPPNSLVDEHDLDDEINRRISAMLQYLPGNSELSVIGHTADKLNSRVSQALGKKTSLQNAAVVSLESVTILEQQTDHQDNVSTDKQEKNSALHEPLVAPSWLSEIENRFNSNIKDKRVETEPVINVTIGRVEVRAIKTDAAQKVGRSKKPTGVMPLDEYLKKREDRGAR